MPPHWHNSTSIRKTHLSNCAQNLCIFGLVDGELGCLMSEQDARIPRFGYERMMSPSAETGEQVREALVK